MKLSDGRLEVVVLARFTRPSIGVDPARVARARCGGGACAVAGFAYNACAPMRMPVRSGRRLRFLAHERAAAGGWGTHQQVGQWQGKVVVVNFWATWCAPCREEIPLFIKLQKQYAERGVQFVGIAIDDATKVKLFAAELGMNFPVLVAGANAIDLTRKLGNRAAVLPFTLVVSRGGKVVASEIGTAHNAKLQALLLSLL